MRAATLGQDAEAPDALRMMRADFYLIFLVSFILCLGYSICMRLFPHHWRAAPPSGGRALSIFAEAKASARTCVSFAFMG